MCGYGVQRCPRGPYSLCSSGAGSRGFAARVSVVRGVCGQALSLPRLSALWAGCRGPLSTLAVGAGVRVWGPGAVPSACMPCWGRAPRGWLGLPGRLARHRCEGRLVSGAVPPPVARPLGGLLGSASKCCGRRCAGVGARHCPPSLHALWELRAARLVGAAPRGVACHHGEGRLVSDDVPPRAARPLGRVAGVPRPVCPRYGRRGRGDPAPAPQRAPWWAGVARRGGGGRASPGGCLPLLKGASDVRRSPSPDCPYTWRAVGVHYPRAVGAGV